MLLPHLLVAAGDDDDRVAMPALATLERLAPPSAVSRLRPLLADRRRRAPVARILARIDTAEAADALLGGLTDAEVRDAFRLAGTGCEPLVR